MIGKNVLAPDDGVQGLAEVIASDRVEELYPRVMILLQLLERAVVRV